jgi:CO dehydrogenase maturation factor
LPGAYCHDVDGVKLLVLGGIESAGSGCACPEGAFLKSLLAHSILYSKEAILVDLAAGVEFMGRACVQGVDGLVVVVEPGRRSIDTALNIANMAGKMGISKVAAFINKVTDESQVEDIKSALTDIYVLGSFGYSKEVQQADLQRTSVWKCSNELVEELKNAKNRMMELFFGG